MFERAVSDVSVRYEVDQFEYLDVQQFADVFGVDEVDVIEHASFRLAQRHQCVRAPVHVRQFVHVLKERHS